MKDTEIKVRLTIKTGRAPNLTWARLCRMTDAEIEAFNDSFMRFETEEFILDTARVTC